MHFLLCGLVWFIIIMFIRQVGVEITARQKYEESMKNMVRQDVILPSGETLVVWVRKEDAKPTS